jgi:hypothetical protein
MLRDVLPVAAAKVVAVVKCSDWQRRKKFAQGSQLYAAGSTWGSGPFASPVSIPIHTRPQKDPYLVLSSDPL